MNPEHGPGCRQPANKARMRTETQVGDTESAQASSGVRWPRHSMAQHGTAWHSIGTAWNSMASRGTAWHSMPNRRLDLQEKSTKSRRGIEGNACAEPPYTGSALEACFCVLVHFASAQTSMSHVVCDC